MEEPIGGSGEITPFELMPDLDLLGMDNPKSRQITVSSRKKKMKVLSPAPTKHLSGGGIVSERSGEKVPLAIRFTNDTPQISVSNKVEAMTPGESPLSPIKFLMPESNTGFADDYYRASAKTFEGYPQYEPFQSQPKSVDNPEELLNDIEDIIKKDPHTQEKEPVVNPLAGHGSFYDMSDFQAIRKKEIPEEPTADEDVIFVKEEPCPEFGINMRGQGQDMASFNVQVRPEESIEELFRVLNARVNYKLWDIKPKAREPSQHFKPGEVVFGVPQSCEELINSDFVPSQTTGITLTEYLRPTLDGRYSEGQEFNRKSVIGAGSYGKVYLCIDNTTHKEFVMKKINKNYKKTEVEILLKLNHNNIAKLFGLVHRQGEPEMFMENCGRSLLQFAVLPDTAKLLTEDRIWDFMKQGLQALNYLEIHQIIHFDIKPENICIQQVGNKYIIKLTDFGSARVPQEVISYEGWTAEYMSPEACRMFLESRFPYHNLPAPEGDYTVSCQTDVFSWGMTVQFMIRKIHVLIPLITNGKNSYKGLDENEVATLRLRMIMWMATAPHHVKECMIPDVENQHLKELLQGLLEGCPEKRWSPARGIERIEEIESSFMRNNKDTLSPLPSDQSIASSTSEISETTVSIATKSSQLARRRISSLSSNGSVCSYTDAPPSLQGQAHTIQPRRMGYKRRSSVKKKLRERISCPYKNPSEIHCMTPSVELDGNVPNFGAMFDL